MDCGREPERQEVPGVLQIGEEQWGCRGGRTSRTGRWRHEGCLLTWETGHMRCCRQDLECRAGHGVAGGGMLMGAWTGYRAPVDSEVLLTWLEDFRWHLGLRAGEGS